LNIRLIPYGTKLIIFLLWHNCVLNFVSTLFKKTQIYF